MNMLFFILAIINVVIWVCSVLMFVNYLRKKPIFHGGNCSDNEIIYPSLSVVVAACNEEESIGQSISQLIDQDYPNLDVIVVNDRSTDHTGDILKELKNKYPQLKVITITELPPNWLGKTHAVYQGAKEATGEWLLFTDADVMFSSGSLKETLRYSLENKLDHLTINPNIISKGFFFGGLISIFMFAISYIFMMSKSAGLGAFNLIKKSTYEGIVGYKAIAMDPIDDFALGKLVVRKGYNQCFGFSKGLISVRLYDNISAMIKGIEKNQFAGTNYSIISTIVACLLNFFMQVYPFLGIFFGPEWARILCGFSILIIIVYYNFSKRYLDVSLKQFLIHPISASIYLWAILNSMVKTLSRGGLEWRGTFYSLAELKKHAS